MQPSAPRHTFHALHIRQQAAFRVVAGQRHKCAALLVPESPAALATFLGADDSSTHAAQVETLRPSHMEQVARLRADAYYEDERSRFVESFKKQFAAQEMDSLQRRTTRGINGTAPQTECLVAMQPSSSGQQGPVVGCIDIRLPFTETGVQPLGVPVEDAQGAYILNVVVHEDYRGRGIGRALMLAAMQRAVHVWHASSLYTHVEADNEVAYRLYARCGFQEHSSESKYRNATNLGRLILLHAAGALIA